MLLNINNSKFKVKIVVSEKEVQLGMMGRKFDKNFNGMLIFASPFTPAPNEF